jgi:hypothetical protein
MSSDYQQALGFEPKYIRLGTILFGKRVWESFTYIPKKKSINL